MLLRRCRVSRGDREKSCTTAKKERTKVDRRQNPETRENIKSGTHAPKKENQKGIRGGNGYRTVKKKGDSAVRTGISMTHGKR